jgi:hypothetical protein
MFPVSRKKLFKVHSLKNEGIDKDAAKQQDKLLNNSGINISDKPVKETTNSSSGSTSRVDSLQKPLVTETNTASTSPQNKDVNKTDSSGKKSFAKKSDNISKKGFYFTAAIAGDAIGVKKFTTKDIKPVYGAGFGYRFNNRLSVQTGFFAGKRIYTAGPDDYRVKPGSYIAKIISADAECIIYDIPLLMRYDVFQRKKYNIYVTTGLSSFLLKRETYDMHFFNPSGTYRRMSYTYKDNNDFFSIVNVSVGFEHKLSDAFFIQAEPYIKMPLSGVGEGDVKLYSTGLQLGIRYQPVRRKK